jgi:L-threonylcarbamoyladenylate synthase
MSRADTPPTASASRILRPDPKGLDEAAALLRAGALVAFGTETVYGLGGDATNDQAVAAIFAAKGRPRFNPLICHYSYADEAFAHVAETPAARRLARAFWPGPLTLVLPRRAGCMWWRIWAGGSRRCSIRVRARWAWSRRCWT